MLSSMVESFEVARVHCVGIAHLQGCRCSSAAVETSWLHPFSQPQTFTSLREWSGQNVEQYTILHTCHMFSYPCLLICPSCCGPFVCNSFYHWLYIIINSIYLWGHATWLVVNLSCKFGDNTVPPLHQCE